MATLKGRVLQPLPGQAFIGFLIAYIKEGSHSLCSGLLGNYSLKIAKERMLPITSYRLTRKKCCKCKGTIRVIGLITLQSMGELAQVQEVTLRIRSKHLLLQLRVSEF